MEASLGRIRDLQLVICHAIAVAKQHPPLAGHQHRASEVPGLNEGLEVSLQTIRYLPVRQVLTVANTAKNDHACDMQSATERFHSRPSKVLLKTSESTDGKQRLASLDWTGEGARPLLQSKSKTNSCGQECPLH